MSRAKKPAPEAEAPAPEFEERPFPALGSRLLAEIEARYQREIAEVIEEIAAAAEVPVTGGWHADVQGRRFVRQVPGE
jgi:hypothetical protein